MTQRRDDGAARGQDFPQCARISVFVTVKCGVWAMRNRAWPDVVLFLLLSSAYYGSHYPIAASNEGSHFALTRALAEEHTCVIDTFFDYTAGVDFSYRDGRFYSDRPPGTAFLAVPFHVQAQELGARVAALLQPVGVDQAIAVVRRVGRDGPQESFLLHPKFP